MNPANNYVAASAAVALAPPPQPPLPHRLSTSCDRHPDESFTGFCPCCLFERLSVLEVNTKDAAASSSSRKPPLSAAALKAIFKPASTDSTAAGVRNTQRVRPGLLPELRRTKSFSATKNEGLSGTFEPQRRSCDVRGRNTLWSLFNEDDEHNPQKKSGETGSCTGSIDGGRGEIEIERRNSSVRSPAIEGKTESESEQKEKSDHRVALNGPIEPVDEIVEEEYEGEEEDRAREEETKQVKENMESNPQAKKPNRDLKEIAGSFWSAASVFSKKLQKWRQKQKLKKHRNGRGGGSTALPVDKPIGRHLRDTQSEIADYGYGRRSCDTDPRFSIDAGRFSLDAGRISLDAGRVSVDGPRYSFDEPRASWDGYLIGRTAPPPRMPSMLSVVEDSPVSNHVLRSDTQIPVEDHIIDENAPGGSAQTREYYSDSSSRRRKSLDRSSSIRKTAAALMAEIEEPKAVSNAKVSPFQDRDSKDLYSLRDDCSVENLEIGFRENSDNKKAAKKSKRWSWNIFGLIHRKNGSKYEDDDEEDDDERSRRRGGGTRVERTFSGSWNGESRKGFDPKMMRSNSSVSWRSSRSLAGGEGSGFRRSNADGYINGKKRINGNKVENGMLRFYLTPMRGSRRGSANTTRANPIARSAMKMF